MMCVAVSRRAVCCGFETCCVLRVRDVLCVAGLSHAVCCGFTTVLLLQRVLAQMTVTSPPGTVIGHIEQQWDLFLPKFNILNEHKECVLKVEGPCFTCNVCGDVEFKVRCYDHNEWCVCCCAQPVWGSWLMCVESLCCILRRIDVTRTFCFSLMWDWWRMTSSPGTRPPPHRRFIKTRALTNLTPKIPRIVPKNLYFT